MFLEFIQNTSPQINFLKNGGSLKENIVKNATENFLQRNNLNSSTIREACERFLWESIRKMREEDPFLYEEMYNNFSSRTQTRLLEERLEMEFIDISKIVKILSESICSCFERAIEINECDGDIAYEFAVSGYNICTEDVRYAMGRCMWVKNWGLNILSPEGKPLYNMLHFLGSHCPAEKRYLKTLFSKNSKVSMDTGYPVKLAIKGEVLGEEKAKPKIIIDDFMYDEFDTHTVRLIEDNINTFKGY